MGASEKSQTRAAAKSQRAKGHEAAERGGPMKEMSHGEPACRSIAAQASERKGGGTSGTPVRPLIAKDSCRRKPQRHDTYCVGKPPST